MSEGVDAVLFIQAQIHALGALALGLAKTLTPMQREGLATHLELVLADLIAQSHLSRLSGQLDPGSYPDLLRESFHQLIRQVRESI